jgi:hypothetical protein
LYLHRPGLPFSVGRAAGEYIVTWHVGLAGLEMVHPSDGQKSVTVVVALQGLTNKGTRLAELSTPDQRVDSWVTVDAEDTSLGFSKLNGKGSGWFTNFMGYGEDDVPWSLDSRTDLGLTAGRVVGYQLRCWGPVDTARFCFSGATCDLVSGLAAAMTYEVCTQPFVGQLKGRPALKHYILPRQMGSTPAQQQKLACQIVHQSLL